MNQTALVTGASSGIGAAFARALAARGHDVILVARREDRLVALAAELESRHGVRCTPLPMDLARPEAPDELLAAVESRGLQVDLLINNAGVCSYEGFERLTRAQVSAMVTLNVSALTALTHAFLPAMLARESGGIVQVASAAAFQPIPFGAVYAATKAYVLSFSEALAEEVAARGVRVVCVCPGSTESEIHELSNVKRSLLERSRPMPSEAVVAEALTALKMRQRVVVPGVHNALTAHAARLLPRRFVTFVAGRLFDPASPG